MARGLRLLSLLAAPEFAEGASIAQLSKTMGLTTSSTYRYLVTLIDGGFAEPNGSANRYRLGLEVLRLAAAALGNQRLRDVAADVLSALGADTGEAIHLNVPHGTKMVLVHRIDSRHPIQMHQPVGTVSPMHATASGKAMLAWLPPSVFASVVEAGLSPVTPCTITDPERLASELRQIGESGYAIDDRESNIEVRCVAAPIFDYAGNIAGAISISAPATRLSIERATELGARVRLAAATVSQRMGAAPGAVGTPQTGLSAPAGAVRR